MRYLVDNSTYKINKGNLNFKIASMVADPYAQTPSPKSLNRVLDYY